MKELILIYMVGCIILFESFFISFGDPIVLEYKW